MSSAQAPYRGRVQAQGDDIDKKHLGGYSEPWAQHTPVTDDEGFEFLAKLEGQCKKHELELRKIPFSKAKRFIKRASEQGGVEPEGQPRSFYNKTDSKYHNVRVDIEIISGLTFIPAKQSK
jgi:hypothetical protein